MYIEKLVESLGEGKVTQNETELARHSHDESMHSAVKPDVVCFPETTKDVVKIMKIAQAFNIAITPFGAGSGLEGQAIPINGGIVISTERMNRIVEFRADDLAVTVQPGVTRLTLNKYINRYGMTFPIDPGADASLGGMAATNASGTTAVRYGSMADQILKMTIVLADGTVITTGTKAKKSSSGYHLNELFIGSEGTLGIITELTLTLHGIPEEIIFARCTFKTPSLCAEAAQSVLLSGINVRRMEFVDPNTIKRVNQYGGYAYPEKHSLFFEFAGMKQSVEEEAFFTEEIIRDIGCENWEVAKDSKGCEELWKARHEMSYAFRHMQGYDAFSSDVCVPLSELPTMIHFATDLLSENDIKGGIFGHVGDGNFHTMLTFKHGNQEERDIALKINDQVVDRALQVGGTCTGEHGVGLGKMNFQAKEHGNSLKLMKGIKQLVDPQGILNPGKIFK